MRKCYKFQVSTFLKVCVLHKSKTIGGTGASFKLEEPINYEREGKKGVTFFLSLNNQMKRIPETSLLPVVPSRQNPNIR